MFFFPEGALLAPPIRYVRLTALAAVLAAGLAAAPVTAGLFGISIPANYGNWFTGIYRLYVQNQDVIANARKLYIAYLKVSNTVDALRGFDAVSKRAFKERWRSNAEVLLQANLAFEADRLFDGDEGVVGILKQITGITLDEESGSYRIRPETVGLLAVKVTGDPRAWSDALLAGPVPAFSSFLTRDSEFLAAAHEILSDQPGQAYADFAEALNTRVSERIVAAVQNHPERFLDCGGYEPCWTPFGSGGQVQEWTWEEILGLMFNPDHPVHGPEPLPGELAPGPGGFPEDPSAYLHRRLAAAIWRAMGRELHDKIVRAETAIAERCNQVAAAARDVENLATLLDHIHLDLAGWDPSGGDGIASLVATAFSLTADGHAKDQAANESYLTGLIAAKLRKALDRARLVKARAAELVAALRDLRAQMEAFRPWQRPYRRLLNRRHLDLAEGVDDGVPGHHFLAAPDPFRKLSLRLREKR